MQQLEVSLIIVYYLCEGQMLRRGFEMESDGGADCIFLENPCERVVFRESGIWYQEFGDMPMLALVAGHRTKNLSLCCKKHALPMR